MNTVVWTIYKANNWIGEPESLVWIASSRNAAKEWVEWHKNQNRATVGARDWKYTLKPVGLDCSLSEMDL